RMVSIIKSICVIVSMGKKRWKDRKDGYYLYDADPMHKFMPFLMPKRTESEVYLTETIDMTDVLAYLEERKKIEGNSVTLFSLLMAAVVRTFAMRPTLNNFIAGYRLYRRHKIDIGFVVKKEFSDEGLETVVRIAFDPSMTVTEISDKMYSHVKEFRTSESAGTDSTIKTLSRMPRPITKFFMSFLRFLNYYGKVPKSLIDSDPNFASLFVANLGSLKAKAPFHHLNNWGTNSIFMSIAAVEDRLCVIDGEIKIRKFMDLAFTVDERISDGFYFMKSIRMVKEMLSDPAVLEIPYTEVSANNG
ncbi:MAG: 2-oxo acid dehydrogenase subunit E2, partial [Methanomassiliicoccaceae archaeon]|nr:2-oxo acid dehydrogenase subunit E2 [Methanomassiliicoccaceae archaeon]